jgi:hypothetical protein
MTTDVTKVIEMTTTMAGRALASTHASPSQTHDDRRRIRPRADQATGYRRLTTFNRVMFGLTLLYLTVEIPFGGTLVDAMSAGHSVPEVERIEMMGRIVSGIAVALAVAGWLGRKWLMNGRSSFGIVRGLIPVCAICILAVYVGEKKVVEILAEATSVSTRHDIAMATLTKRHIENGGKVDFAIDRSDPGIRTMIGSYAMVSADDAAYGTTAERVRIVESIIPEGSLPQYGKFRRDMLDPALRQIESKRQEIEDAKAKIRRGGMAGHMAKRYVDGLDKEDRAMFRKDSSTPRSFFGDPAVHRQVVKGLGLTSYKGEIYPLMSDEKAEVLHRAVVSDVKAKLADAYLSGRKTPFSRGNQLHGVGIEVAKAAIAPVLAFVLSLAGAFVHVCKATNYGLLSLRLPLGKSLRVPLALVAGAIFVAFIWKPVHFGSIRQDGVVPTIVATTMDLQRGLYPLARGLGDAGPYAYIFPVIAGDLKITAFDKSAPVAPTRSAVATAEVEREILGVTTGKIPLPRFRPAESIESASSVSVDGSLS